MDNGKKHNVKITYILHSCYVVEFETFNFVFDYYDGEIQELLGKKKTYFFASHVHSDHYSPKVFQQGRASRGDCYILSKEIGESEKKPSELVDSILYVDENHEYQIGDVKINTFHSTDVGVAFLIEYDGKKIFHAGDLNWWHWNGEPDEFNKGMKRDFKAEVAKIKQTLKEKDRSNESIDIGFLLLDTRMENASDWGMMYYMNELSFQHVFPMHFFSDTFEICKVFEDNHTEFLEGKGIFYTVNALMDGFEIEC